MKHNIILNNEENAKLELYSELHKGLKAIDEGRVKTSEEVRIHMTERRNKYLEKRI